jgi:hypothetical protein
MDNSAAAQAARLRPRQTLANVGVNRLSGIARRATTDAHKFVIPSEAEEPIKNNSGETASALLPRT